MILGPDPRVPGEGVYAVRGFMLQDVLTASVLWRLITREARLQRVLVVAACRYWDLGRPFLCGGREIL